MNAHFLPPRAQWVRLWSALPATHLAALAEGYIQDLLRIEDITLPEAGLAMLKLRDAALLETWYIGEVPLARAHVRVHTRDGRTAEGAAQCLDDRPALARHLALLDAVLAARLPGWEAAADALTAGARLREEEAAARAALLAATRVDFALLSEASDD